MGKQGKRRQVGAPRGKERRIRVRGIRRDPPDVQKFSRAIVALALAQAEADAEAQRQAAEAQSPPPAAPDDEPTTDGAR